MRSNRYERLISSDFMLRGAGVALAAGSLAFAAQQLSRPTQPQIAGLEHLAIYARPASRVAQPLRRERAIDYTPIGSTHSHVSGALLGAYEIVEASGDSALVRLPEGRIQRVAPGSRIAGLGSVTGIRRSAQGWIVITQSGVIRQN
jgi:hypothetical protein